MNEDTVVGEANRQLSNNSKRFVNRLHEAITFSRGEWLERDLVATTFDDLLCGLAATIVCLIDAGGALDIEIEGAAYEVGYAFRLGGGDVRKLLAQWVQSDDDESEET